MGLYEVYKFVEKKAVSYMGGEIERRTREFKRTIRDRSDDELRALARKIEEGEYSSNTPYTPILREEMRRRGMI